VIDRREVLGAGIAAASGLASNPAVAGEDLASLDLLAAAALLRRGEVSPEDLTQACLARIAALDPALNAFITVTAERALAEARLAGRELARGRPRGPLHGIPVALKDNIDTAGVRTTGAAAAFANRVPAGDAEVARRLREAGAVLLGKLNMDECAYGVTSTTGHFGAVHNPWNAAHVAGGSSGGPAAAVAARMCYAALGTDTGGSIRQPAAWCGITGLKPTYGLVSCRGVMPLSWSLDHVGPMCRTAADAAAVLQVVAGHDPADPASLEGAVPAYERELRARTRRLRLGRARGSWYAGLEPDVAAAVEAALALLGELTAGVAEVDLPDPPGLPLLFVEARSWLRPAREASPDGFSPAVRGLIEMGGRIEATTYAEALRTLARVRRESLAVFAAVDLVVTPTTPDTAMTLAASAAPQSLRGPPPSARNTTPFNVFGWPTVSVCCGFSRAGLPIGLQLSGPPRADATVLALAHAYQQNTDWHLRAPAGGAA
jgi:aspartyl-tRNA(Asn)/glutamyl-tRNA(Gln) amidotransferase subunit A